MRSEAIDLARGWALLGVAMVNVQALARGWTNHYSLDLANTWYDVFAEYVVGIVFAHRAFPTLAFLLGVGLAFQWRSQVADAASNPLRARSTMRARYVALLGLGVAHGLLLWPGDIVSAYAVVALVLLWKWPLSERALVRWVCVFGALLLLMYGAYLGAMWSSPALPETNDPAPSFANTEWLVALAMHPSEYLMFGLTQATLPEVWLAVVIGVWLGQSERFNTWLRDGNKSSRRWFAAGVASFAIGTALELAASRLGGWNFDYGAWPGRAVFMLGVPFAAFGSVFIVLAVARAWTYDRFSTLRSLFIAAGKTPLTLFFGMSLVMVPIFHDAFIGWHGDLGRASYSLVAATTFFLLAGFSRAWLAAGHARGPIEIVWLRLAARMSPRPRAQSTAADASR